MPRDPEERLRLLAEFAADYDGMTFPSPRSIAPTVEVVGGIDHGVIEEHRRHAQRLAAQFGAPLETWYGGHLLQLGRRRAFARLEAFLCHRVSV